MLPKRLANTPAGIKVCGHCQKELPKTNDFFDRASDKEDGFKNWCKACRKEKRDLVAAKNAAELMKTLDTSVIANLAEAKPGGTTVPHAAEIYQCVMALMGGVQGFAMHWAGTFVAAKPGSQTRERMLGGMQKLAQAVSDTNKVSMPAELMSDEDLDQELKRREERMKVLPAVFADSSEATENADNTDAQEAG